MDWPCGTSIVAIGCQGRDRQHRPPALEDRIETVDEALEHQLYGMSRPGWIVRRW
jgi:hypothetical protein